MFLSNSGFECKYSQGGSQRNHNVTLNHSKSRSEVDKASETPKKSIRTEVRRSANIKSLTVTPDELESSSAEKCARSIFEEYMLFHIYDRDNFLRSAVKGQRENFHYDRSRCDDWNQC